MSTGTPTLWPPGPPAQAQERARLCWGWQQSSGSQQEAAGAASCPWPAARPQPEGEMGKEDKGPSTSLLGAGAGAAQPTCSVCWMVRGKNRRVQRGKVPSPGALAGPSGLVRGGTMASTFPRGPSVPESSNGVRQRRQRLSK